jgi:hypothetical protein
MADSPKPTIYQAFANTFLLATPTELHRAWIEQRQDYATLSNIMGGLGFSDDAVTNARTTVYDRLNAKTEILDAMGNLAQKLAGGFYPPNGGAHPMFGDAQKIVLALRHLDELSNL